jgi:hypothetical protein
MNRDAARARAARLGLWVVATNVAIFGTAAFLGSGGGGGAGAAVRGFAAWCGIG